MSGSEPNEAYYAYLSTMVEEQHDAGQHYDADQWLRVLGETLKAYEPDEDVAGDGPFDLHVEFVNRASDAEAAGDDAARNYWHARFEYLHEALGIDEYEPHDVDPDDPFPF